MLRQLPIAVAAIIALEIGQLISNGEILVPWKLDRLPLPVRWTAYAAFVMLVIMFGVYQQMNFIYFQF